MQEVVNPASGINTEVLMQSCRRGLGDELGKGHLAILNPQVVTVVTSVAVCVLVTVMPKLS